MTSTFSPNKNLEEPASGDYNDAWATPVNANWTAIDNAFGGLTNVTVTGGSLVLSLTQSQPPNIIISGTLTNNAAVLLPDVGGLWSVSNNTTGIFTVELSNDVGGGQWRYSHYLRGSAHLSSRMRTNVDFASTPSVNSGTFTGTLFGLSPTITGPINYVISGGVAYIHVINQFGGTSVNNTLSMTGIPTQLVPAFSVGGPCGQILDNGFALAGFAIILGNVNNLQPCQRPGERQPIESCICSRGVQRSLPGSRGWRRGSRSHIRWRNGDHAQRVFRVNAVSAVCGDWMGAGLNILRYQIVPIDDAAADDCRERHERNRRPANNDQYKSGLIHLNS